MVLKLKPFNEPGKEEFQGFRGRNEIQQKSNRNVPFNFLIYLIIKLVHIY